jgi:hypothetical protein
MAGDKKAAEFTIPDDATLSGHAAAMKGLHEKAFNKPNKTHSKLADAVPVTMTTHQKGPVLLKWLQVLTKTE